LASGTCALSEASETPQNYYKKWTVVIEASRERNIQVKEEITYHNSSSNTIRLTINHPVPFSNVANIRVWDDSGPLEFTWDGENISFKTRRIAPNSDYTYRISFTAIAAVGGTGFEYRVYVWGRTLRLRCDNYTIVVRGPENTYPFLSTISAADVVSYDPPTFRISGLLEPRESIPGGTFKFYESPGYYLVEARYDVKPTAYNDRFVLDVIVLNRDNRLQFSALVSALPTPDSLYFDEDNNLHLVFELEDLAPPSVYPVRMQMLYEVQVYDPKITAERVLPITEIPPSYADYLSGDNELWAVQNPDIQRAVEELVQDELNAYTIAEKLMDFVVERIEYEVQEKRRGALWAYLNGRGDCSEYTDLLITLARASGIPARAVYGWGYYEEENLRGHAWVELYLPGAGWQPFDPTWAETSGDYFARMDSIHLVRSVRGIRNSESWLSYISFGPLPEYDDDWKIEPVSPSQVTEHYLSAAGQVLELASQLVKKTENDEILTLWLEAEERLASARNATDPQLRIVLSKEAISLGYDLIAALGEKPYYGGYMLNLRLLLVAVVIAAGAGAVGLLLRRSNK
jgi:transglutaminase-like putative cysteine protease